MKKKKKKRRSSESRDSGRNEDERRGRVKGQLTNIIILSYKIICIYCCRIVIIPFMRVVKALKFEAQLSLVFFPL